MLSAKLLGASGTAAKTYIDDVFSAWTFSGTGASQVITNGIDLSGKGGMVWQKIRNSGADWHRLHHSARGTSLGLYSNDTSAQGADSYLTAFGSTGFTHGTTLSSANTLIAWTFRNADKFYAHTTVTKSSGSNATVSFANLTTLGMVRVKRTDAAGSWYIWHRSLTAGKLLIGETTAAEATLGHITVSGTTVTLVNGTIADGSYLVEGFAHDTSTDGLIQCGSYAVNGSGIGSATLNWEPQFIIAKSIGGVGNWVVYDSARGFNAPSTASNKLLPNSSSAEATGAMYVNATGFSDAGSIDVSTNIAFIAIRRPNKPPTLGTQVYNAIARTGTGAAATVTGVGFAPDALITHNRNNGSSATWTDRLRGSANALTSNATTAEQPSATTLYPTDEFTVMDGVKIATSGQVNGGTGTYINHFFKRAPGVLSQICYSGTGANKTESHDLGVAPELWLVKGRSGATQWVWGSSLLANTEKIVMPTPAGKVTDATAWNSTYPTSTVLSLGTAAAVNTSAATYVAYLWATKAGISKVFSYTGDGTSGKVINCGFTTGARFVMIVRTSAAGSVFIWDTARGIVAGNDPHLCLDTTAAEVTTDDSIDPDTSGFAINQVAATNINVNGATYIGLAYS